MSYIHFDCVRQFAQYPSLENELEQLRCSDKTTEEKAGKCVEICQDLIKEHGDFKTCLGVIFNYYPSKYHYTDYEGTVFLISALANDLIDEEIFQQKTGLSLAF